MMGIVSNSRKTGFSFFQALRELSAPISALTVLMLVLNVSILAGLASTANAGQGPVAFFTCLNPDRVSVDMVPGGDIDQHDCVSCCLAAASALQAPASPGIAVAITFTIAEPQRPSNARPNEPSGHPSAPIRAPPFFS